MLTLDIADLSEPELKKAVAGHCSRFGLVLDIWILRPEDSRHDTVAAVEMSTRTEARRLLKACGDRAAGGTVIMRLVQQHRQPK